MKKVFAIFATVAILVFGMTMNVVAQEAAPATVTEEAVVDSAAAVATEDAVETEVIVEETGMHKALKTKFIEGGAGFMSTVAFCLIFGLALAIERIIYLNLSSVNTKKLLTDIDQAWTEGGVAAAMDVCRNTRGPVASIFYQGLSRYDEGVEVVEKSVASYGSVQLGLLEKNLSWISLFIALSPMLGFLGTVVGMIEAFDKIQQAGDISATIVAGGIKVALLTTLFGLVAAIILQIFYNYILSRIEALVNDMEDSSISLLDIVVKHSVKK
ncbi:MAG TPA: MotA/TolQ/ExbB proton channel family protein [Paludibacteraceae bacterium]|nr:MotA/TolQ/ExbB proton channel family protein [Paludibacteraceae bacterium]HQB68886.1 MotA/TolQ/ExbB proton channel family protein [Paludibacteraceae bacterium]HRS67152.1 MotA/TolQ/ExbB proton channel family protein [Paludibacteraceae bacterium]